MNEVFLCLGGNLGNRLENIEKATALIAKHLGKIVKKSAIYETEPWGSASSKKHLNQCLLLLTKTESQKLINELLLIEKKLGRNREGCKNGDRVIDIDILLFNNEVIKSKNLQVPHPRMHLRNFVLVPLNEIAATKKHPILKKNMSTLLKTSTDKLLVKKQNSFKLICIEGNIGSGKTTLGLELAKSINAYYIKEEFEDNTLLPLFYKNPKKFSFALEISFLLARFNQLLKALSKNDKHIVCDYSIYKCLWFAKVNLTDKNYKHFQKLFHNLASQLVQPHTIIYLKTSNSNLQQNIKKRGRPYEQEIKQEYLKRVNLSYEKGLKKLDGINKKQVEIKNYQKNTFKNLIKEIQQDIK